MNMDLDTKNHLLQNTKPKGWVCIEEHLPTLRAIDIIKGGTEYKVRFESGEEGTTIVSDHAIWYNYALTVGITHWYNL